MDEYFLKLEKLFSKGDPVLTSWFLVRNDYLPIILIVFYVLISTVIGPALMRHRKPFNLRNCMIIFNFSIVVAYAVCLVKFIWILQYCEHRHFCKNNDVTKNNIAYTLAYLSWFLYVLKYVEFFDTIFFVLRKKQNQITLLHVMHHAFLPLLIWLTMKSESTGFQIFPLSLNAFVHIVMYSYYGLSAMGPSVRKHLWWKKYLTQLQIIQFVLIVILATIIVPLIGCKIGMFSYVTNFIFVPLILLLFCKFYKENYQTRRKSVEDKNVYNKIENGVKHLSLFSSSKQD